MQPPVPQFPMPIPTAPITSPAVAPNQTPGTGHGATHAYGYDAIPEVEQARADLTAEIARAIGVEDAIEAAYILADMNLQTNITAEATARAAADTALGNRVTTLEGLTEAKLYLAAGQQLTSNSTAFQSVTWFGSSPGLTLLANAIWHFRMSLIFISSVAAGFKFQFIGPAGCALLFSTGNLAPVGNFSSVGLSSPISAAGTAALIGIEIWGTVINGATAGTLILQAAQNAATVENTDFVSVGSNMQATKVA